MELEVERGRDVRIRILLEGQIDVQADGLASRFMSAQVRGFHDAGAAAGGDDKAMTARRNVRRPFRKQVGEAARVFVVARHVNGSFGALHVERVIAPPRHSRSFPVPR